MAAKKKQEKDDLRKKSGIRLFLAVGVGAIIVLCFILAAVLLVWPSKAIKELISKDILFNGTLDDLIFPWHPTENTSLDPLRVISRMDWLAQPPEQPLEPLNHPVSYVIISRSDTEPCKLLAECIQEVRYIQMFHIEGRGWFDIAYNFLVGGDGNVYEGRGWDAIGAHTYSYNNRSIGINLVGTFATELPPEKQLLATKQLIEEGMKLEYIAKDYKLLAQRQVSNTASPGQLLFEELKKWPHWASEP